MKREISLDELTDGRFYSRNDMVKVGCNDCAGCSDCCQDMGNSIVLDPYDVNQLVKHLGLSFEQLVADQLALHMIDGVILPTLRLRGKKTSIEHIVNNSSIKSATSGTEACPFLDENGRCSIHAFRPGFCRLFPLGRYYVNNSFQYILQCHECPQGNKTKIKVDKWLGIPNLPAYESFINEWHYFLLAIEELLGTSEDENEKKTLHMYLLNTFYSTPYGDDFFSDFHARITKVKAILLP